MILGFANLFFGAATEKLTTVVQAALASGYSELIDMMLTITPANGFGVIEGTIFWVTGTMTMAFASIKSDAGRQVLKGTITGFLIAEPFFKLLSNIMFVQIAGCDKVGNATLAFPKGEPAGTIFMTFGVACCGTCATLSTTSLSLSPSLSTSLSLSFHLPSLSPFLSPFMSFGVACCGTCGTCMRISTPCYHHHHGRISPADYTAAGCDSEGKFLMVWYVNKALLWVRKASVYVEVEGERKRR